jgi:hypothetical protein
MHVSLKFEQSGSPFSYSICDFGTHIEIRYGFKDKDFCSVSIINLPPDIIHNYKDRKIESFMGQSDISAEIVQENLLMIRAGKCMYGSGPEFVNIPIHIWETYTTLAIKAETEYEE